MNTEKALKFLNDRELYKNSYPEDDLQEHIARQMQEYADQQLNLYIVSNCAKVKDKPTPLNWLLRDKLGIERGTTYIEPNISIRQCASWISEYVKKYCG